MHGGDPHAFFIWLQHYTAHVYDVTYCAIVPTLAQTSKQVRKQVLTMDVPLRLVLTDHLRYTNSGQRFCELRLHASSSGRSHRSVTRRRMHTLCAMRGTKDTRLGLDAEGTILCTCKGQIQISAETVRGETLIWRPKLKDMLNVKDASELGVASIIPETLEGGCTLGKHIFVTMCSSACDRSSLEDRYKEKLTFSFYDVHTGKECRSAPVKVDIRGKTGGACLTALECLHHPDGSWCGKLLIVHTKVTLESSGLVSNASVDFSLWYAKGSYTQAGKLQVELSPAARSTGSLLSALINQTELSRMAWWHQLQALSRSRRIQVSAWNWMNANSLFLNLLYVPEQDLKDVKCLSLIVGFEGARTLEKTGSSKINSTGLSVVLHRTSGSLSTRSRPVSASHEEEVVAREYDLSKGSGTGEDRPVNLGPIQWDSAWTHSLQESRVVALCRVLVPLKAVSELCT